MFEALSFDFGDFLPFFGSDILQIQDLGALKMSKITEIKIQRLKCCQKPTFNILYSQTLISRKI